HRVARAAADVRVEAAAEREAARLHAAAQAEPGAAAVGLLDVEGGVVAGGVPVHARVEAGPAGVAVVAAQVLGQRAAADRLGAAEREAGVAALLAEAEVVGVAAAKGLGHVEPDLLPVGARGLLEGGAVLAGARAEGPAAGVGVGRAQAP